MYDKLVTKKGLFKLKSNVGSTFSQIKISDEQDKPLVIVPIFTASAYSENGFYEFFTEDGVILVQQPKLYQ